MITYPSIDRAWRGVVLDLLQNGEEVRPRGQRTKELTHYSFVLSDPAANIMMNPIRAVSQPYAVAEFLWILLGRKDVATIAPFNKRIADFSDDGAEFFGAYGPWVAAQLPYVIKTLQADPDTRQAVMTIWRQSPPPTKDVPCTVAIQYLLRNGRLHAQTFMRSNDAWLGLPYDVFTFTRLQAYVAAAIGVPMGRYVHTVGSMHLYERDWERAGAAVYWLDYGETVLSPELTYPVPAGFADAFHDVGFYAPTYVTCMKESLDLFPEPWATYLGVLAWKRTGEHAFLRKPYTEVA